LLKALEVLAAGTAGSTIEELNQIFGGSAIAADFLVATLNKWGAESPLVLNNVSNKTTITRL
jgi:hypothetical protein